MKIAEKIKLTLCMDDFLECAKAERNLGLNEHRLFF